MQLIDAAPERATAIREFEAAGAAALAVASGAGAAHVYMLYIEPGGQIGPHVAGFGQLLVPLTGSGWVAGADGVKLALAPGQVAHWSRGELHSKGSDVGMSALMIQVRDLGIAGGVRYSAVPPNSTRARSAGQAARQANAPDAPADAMETAEELRRIADELLITTDLKNWSAARALFVDGPIEVDMSSLAGGGPVQMTADQLIDGFRAGLHAGKISHHLAANYRIRIEGARAELWAHGYAWNRVPSLPAGADLWETWGNYRLTFRRDAAGWRLDGFRYYSKLTRGNDAVRTHTA